MPVCIWGKHKHLFDAGGNANWCSHCENHFRSFLERDKSIYYMTWLFHSWTYSQRTDILLKRYLLIHAPWFFYTIMRKYKKPICPTNNELIINVWSSIKKSEIIVFTGKWMEMKTIILSKVTQIHKDKQHMFSLIGEC